MGTGTSSATGEDPYRLGSNVDDSDDGECSVPTEEEALTAAIMFILELGRKCGKPFADDAIRILGCEAITPGGLKERLRSLKFLRSEGDRIASD